MKIGSLFAGIGGLELGLEWAGLGRTVWQVEQNPFCRAVLAKHWPGADRSVTDVRDASPTTLPAADLICGGFPCQDLSVAGDGAGLDGDRSGLWFEFLRIVDECQPAIVVVENVAHGRGRYLCEVRSGMHELGYDTSALLVSAFETGSPHVRDRCFIVAYTDGQQVRQRAKRQPRRRPRGVRSEGQAEPGYARAPAGRNAEPSMGGSFDGVPGRVDGSATGPTTAARALRWPAGMGSPRHEWEPAFACTPGPFHEERLTAIGNAVGPFSAAAVGEWIKEFAL